MGTREDRRVDEKGRITIPQEIRETLQIDPGEEVAVEIEGGRVVISPRISRSAVVDRLGGCVDADSRAPDAEPVDPAELKDDWTSDLPN